MYFPFLQAFDILSNSNNYYLHVYQYGWFRYIFLRLPLNYNLSKFWFSEQHLQEIGNLQFYTVYERVEKKIKGSKFTDIQLHGIAYFY